MVTHGDYRKAQRLTNKVRERIGGRTDNLSIWAAEASLSPADAAWMRQHVNNVATDMKDEVLVKKLSKCRACPKIQFKTQADPWTSISRHLKTHWPALFVIEGGGYYRCDTCGWVKRGTDPCKHPPLTHSESMGQQRKCFADPFWPLSHTDYLFSSDDNSDEEPTESTAGKVRGRRRKMHQNLRNYDPNKEEDPAATERNILPGLGSQEPTAGPSGITQAKRKRDTSDEESESEESDDPDAPVPGPSKTRETHDREAKKRKVETSEENQSSDDSENEPMSEQEYLPINLRISKKKDDQKKWLIQAAKNKSAAVKVKTPGTAIIDQTTESETEASDHEDDQQAMPTAVTPEIESTEEQELHEAVEITQMQNEEQVDRAIRAITDSMESSGKENLLQDPPNKTDEQPKEAEHSLDQNQEEPPNESEADQKTEAGGPPNVADDNIADYTSEDSVPIDPGSLSDSQNLEHEVIDLDSDDSLTEEQKKEIIRKIMQADAYISGPKVNKKIVETATDTVETATMDATKNKQKATQVAEETVSDTTQANQTTERIDSKDQVDENQDPQQSTSVVDEGQTPPIPEETMEGSNRDQPKVDEETDSETLQKNQATEQMETKVQEDEKQDPQQSTSAMDEEPKLLAIEYHPESESKSKDTKAKACAADFFEDTKEDESEEKEVEEDENEEKAKEEHGEKEEGKEEVWKETKVTKGSSKWEDQRENWSAERNLQEALKLVRERQGTNTPTVMCCSRLMRNASHEMRHLSQVHEVNRGTYRMELRWDYASEELNLHPIEVLAMPPGYLTKRLVETRWAKILHPRRTPQEALALSSEDWRLEGVDDTPWWELCRLCGQVCLGTDGRKRHELVHLTEQRNLDAEVIGQTPTTPEDSDIKKMFLRLEPYFSSNRV